MSKKISFFDYLTLSSKSSYKDGFFGKQDLNKLLEQGYDKKVLKNYASSASNPLKFGPLALQQLGIKTVYGYDPGKFNNAFSYQVTPNAGKYSTFNNKSGSSYKYVDAYSLVGPAKYIPGSSGKSPVNPDSLPGNNKGDGKGDKGGDIKIDTPNVPDPPSFQYTPGGVSTTVNSQASGFKSKMSSLKIKGLGSLGTGVFKAAGQNKLANGLNIGV